MTDIINSLLSNDIIVIIGILMASLLVYSILKRLLKIIIFFLILLIVYTAFMVYNGEEVPGSAKKYFEKNSEKIDSLKKGGESFYKVIDSLNKTEDAENAENQ